MALGNRIPSNSASLQKHFPAVYECFFSHCSKVVSSPHSFFWTGELSGFYGGLTITQKLPLRFYVGLQPIAKNNFEIKKEFFAFSPFQQKFHQVVFEDSVYEALESILQDKFKGYRIHFLSEIAVGFSLGAIGAMAACFATLLEKNFTAQVNLARKISRATQKGYSSGATALTSLKDSAYPVISRLQNDKFWSKSLDEIFKLPKHPVWPIDYGLIFSGSTVPKESMFSAIEEIKNNLQSIQKESVQTLNSSSHSLIKEDDFWQIYLKMLNLTSQENFIALRDLFQKGATESALAFFFGTLNQYQNLLHLLTLSTPKIDQVYSTLHQIVNRQENRVGSGAKGTCLGKGGEVLFAVPFGEQEKVEYLISRLNSSLGEHPFHFHLDYASWLDGIEEKGAKIEQDLENKVYTSLLSRDYTLLEIYYQDNQESRLVPSDYSGVQDIDLLLDLIHGKIFIGGNKVNSHELPSQKAAVQILNQLIQKSNHSLNNQQLFAYQNSRYDLQGKIIIPLLKLIKQYLNYELPLKISGGLYDNYSLSMGKHSLKIAVLQKM